MGISLKAGKNWEWDGGGVLVRKVVRLRLAKKGEGECDEDARN